MRKINNKRNKLNESHPRIAIFSLWLQSIESYKREKAHSCKCNMYMQHVCMTMRQSSLLRLGNTACRAFSEDACDMPICSKKEEEESNTLQDRESQVTLVLLTLEQISSWSHCRNMRWSPKVFLIILQANDPFQKVPGPAHLEHWTGSLMGFHGSRRRAAQASSIEWWCN